MVFILGNWSGEEKFFTVNGKNKKASIQNNLAPTATLLDGMAAGTALSSDQFTSISSNNEILYIEILFIH